MGGPQRDCMRADSFRSMPGEQAADERARPATTRDGKEDRHASDAHRATPNMTKISAAQAMPPTRDSQLLAEEPREVVVPHLHALHLARRRPGSRTLESTLPPPR